MDIFGRHASSVLSSLPRLIAVLAFLLFSFPAVADGSASVAATLVMSNTQYYDSLTCEAGANRDCVYQGLMAGSCSGQGACFLFWHEDPNSQSFWRGRGYFCPASYQSLPFLSSSPASGIYESGAWPAAPTCYYGDPPPVQCELDAGSVLSLKVSGAYVTPPSQVCTRSCRASLYLDAAPPTSVSGNSFALYMVDGSVPGKGEYCEPDTPALDQNYQNSCPDGYTQIGGFCRSNDDPNCPAGTSPGEFNGVKGCVDVPPTNCGYVDDSYICTPPPETCREQAVGAGLDPAEVESLCGPLPEGEPPVPETTNPNDATPGHDTGTCPDGQPACGAGSGSKSGYCDPAVDAGCVADGGSRDGGKNSGECPKDNPDCGAGSDSDKGKCDPTKDDQCSPSSVSDGVCTLDTVVPPKCEGNAILCAINQHIFEANCRDKQQVMLAQKYADDPESIFSDTVKNISKTTRDFSGLLNSIDSSGAGFGQSGATCPSDPQVAFPLFGTVTFPFHFLCDWAALVRPIVIALGWVSAGLILLFFLREK